MDQLADLFLLYLFLNSVFILGLFIGNITGLPKNRENSVNPVLSAVTTVALFLMVGLINLDLGLIVFLVYVFTSERYEDRVFTRLLTPLRSVMYILCLQVLSSIEAYLVTKDVSLVIIIGVFHLVYIALALHSFRVSTLEEWATN
ncbi:hypothetical protein [Thermococcus thioreducens]|uniref:Uncharacterized protein n=1 Tax=Thermococcus thioreducens TaxID=277988 RepID=A0A0Q2XKM8_9EURY|nr:hypothetical protein [Thermococcus thioreducens]ASJ13471.1 hypothetical protein A3L14_11530 [Thermococcus thioreducens]KQH81660.1 hypothetical protein AMR53_10165 [Thermococcus thioreducens]